MSKQACTPYCPYVRPEILMVMKILSQSSGLWHCAMMM